MNSQLQLQGLELTVHLGVTAEEQAIAQIVSLNVLINFDSLPKGCHTDQLTDTLCYATLVQTLQQFCANKTFHLIEALGYALHQHLQTHLPKGAQLTRLALTKTPPLPQLKQVTFVIGA